MIRLPENAASRPTIGFGTDQKESLVFLSV